MARTYHDRPAHVVAVGAGESERGDHSASDRDGRPAVPAVVDVGGGTGCRELRGGPDAEQGGEVRSPAVSLELGAGVLQEVEPAGGVLVFAGLARC